MAKAKQIACPDQSHVDPQKWLTKLLTVRFREVLDQRAAALDRANISGVHDMRVATRRLRGALRDFGEIVDCPPIKRVRKGLKKLADELGEVRDHDVAIVALEKFQNESGNPGVGDGIGLLIDERRVRREQEYLDLLKAISATSIENLEQKFTSVVDAAEGQRGLFQPVSVRQAGRDVISERLQDLTDIGSSIYEPFNNKALHKLRLASKNLRDAIELFGTCWDGALDQFAEAVSKMQSHLGEVHDCDVWIGLMSKRLNGKAGAKRENGASTDAAAWLLSEFVRKRSKEYRSALDLWGDWKANDFNKRLIAMISRA